MSLSVHLFVFFRSQEPREAGSSRGSHLGLGSGGDCSAETRPAGGAAEEERSRQAPSAAPGAGGALRPGLISFSIKVGPSGPG